MPIVPTLIVHGGAGDISDARIQGKFAGMKKALQGAIHKILGNCTDPIGAVEAAVRIMEGDENFNAGYGSCLTLDGNVELEASIMEGSKLCCGAVSLLHDIAHPISVARKVLETTPHSFLGGESAQKFAIKEGFEELPTGSLVTASAIAALQEFKKKRVSGQDTTFARTELDAKITSKTPLGEMGTVGAVAIDVNGNIAVATSTGGITGKMSGRIGDTPLIGCGTYADNNSGGVSTTGHGETIMRFNLAQRIIANLVNGMDAQKATEKACTEMTERLQGTGGAIAIDKNGNVGIYWTSKRMAWAYVQDNRYLYGIDNESSYDEPFTFEG